MAVRLHIALVHHPVVDRVGHVVTSAITSVDIHDVARTARTYAVERTYMVTPVTQQRALVDYVRSHWVDAPERQANPRCAALERVTAVASISDAVSDVNARTGAKPWIVTTSAKAGDADIDFGRASLRLAQRADPALVLFGTGWGLAPEASDLADDKLEPVLGLDGYNHLSVRAAVSVVLDRLTAALRESSDGAAGPRRTNL